MFNLCYKYKSTNTFIYLRETAGSTKYSGPLIFQINVFIYLSDKDKFKTAHRLKCRLIYVLR